MRQVLMVMVIALAACAPRGDFTMATGGSGTATPDARLVDVLDAMTRQPGVVGVVENGAVIGVISAQDVVNGLTRHRKVG